VEKQKAGRIIFRQGDSSDSFRIAVSGRFDCYLWDELFKIERPITVFKRGDIFGERVCTHCRMTGLKGRLALYEVLVMTPDLRDAIEKNATMTELQRAAPAGSFISMRRYAKFAMEKGLVNPKDVLEILPATASTQEVK
jgi:hypothetical protein